MDNAIFFEAIEEAAVGLFDGTLHIRHLGEAWGQVIFVEGRVAWAVSRSQPVTLGTFLWRLGFITRSQLDVVKNSYLAHEGRRKLGAILEECGFMTRPVLRRGLQLHIRTALRSLLELDELQCEAVNGSVNGDGELLFKVDEVLPGRDETVQSLAPATEEAWRYWSRWSPTNQVLQPLSQVPDYMAASIYSHEGSLITAHVAVGLVEPVALGVVAAATLEAALHAAGDDVLGVPDQVCVDYPAGRLWARRAGPQGRFVLCLLAGTACAHDVARFCLQRAQTDIDDWLAGCGGADRLTALIEAVRTPTGDVEPALQALQNVLLERVSRDRRMGRSAEISVPFEVALELLRAGAITEATQVLMAQLQV